MASFNEVIEAVKIFNVLNHLSFYFNVPLTIHRSPKMQTCECQTYQRVFDVPVGLSDHTPTNTTSIAAIALGAIAIEKLLYFIGKLRNDQKASLEPAELKVLINDLRECKLALGSSLNSKLRKKKIRQRL